MLAGAGGLHSTVCEVGAEGPWTSQADTAEGRSDSETARGLMSGEHWLFGISLSWGHVVGDEAGKQRWQVWDADTSSPAGERVGTTRRVHLACLMSVIGTENGKRAPGGCRVLAERWGPI